MKIFRKIISLLCLIITISGLPSMSFGQDFDRVSSKEKVTILVTSWCPYCQKLENYLKSKKIRFTRYDIENDTRGKSIHEKLGGGGVPVTLIGSTVVRGFDIEALESALDTPKSSAPVAQPSML